SGYSLASVSKNPFSRCSVLSLPGLYRNKTTPWPPLSPRWQPICATVTTNNKTAKRCDMRDTLSAWNRAANQDLKILPPQITGNMRHVSLAAVGIVCRKTAAHNESLFPNGG